MLEGDYECHWVVLRAAAWCCVDVLMVHKKKQITFTSAFVNLQLE